MNIKNKFRELGFGMVEVLGIAIVFRRGKDIITYDLRSNRVSVKGVLEPEVEQLVERLNNGS